MSNAQKPPGLLGPEAIKARFPDTEITFVKRRGTEPTHVVYALLPGETEETTFLYTAPPYTGKGPPLRIGKGDVLVRFPRNHITALGPLPNREDVAGAAAQDVPAGARVV